jgi:hypothetical protein
MMRRPRSGQRGKLPAISRQGHNLGPVHQNITFVRSGKTFENGPVSCQSRPPKKAPLTATEQITNLLYRNRQRTSFCHLSAAMRAMRDRILGVPQPEASETGQHVPRAPCCSRCGSEEIRRSSRRGWGDFFRSLLEVYPFRCRRCEKRFYLEQRDIPFALIIASVKNGAGNKEAVRQPHRTADSAK